MRLLILFLIGLLLIDIGIQGNLGSIFGSFITPDSMEISS